MYEQLLDWATFIYTWSVTHPNFFTILFSVLSSSVVSVFVGEWLRERNYTKRQKDDFLLRLVRYGFQLSPTYRGDKNDILEALNEAKYWYSNDPAMKLLIFKLMDKMTSVTENPQSSFLEFMEKISKKERHPLTKEEIERVFSTK